MPFENGDFLLAGGVPQAGGLVARRGDNGLAVGAPGLVLRAMMAFSFFRMELNITFSKTAAMPRLRLATSPVVMIAPVAATRRQSRS